MCGFGVGLGELQCFLKMNLKIREKFVLGIQSAGGTLPSFFLLHNKVREHYLLLFRFHFPQKWKWNVLFSFLLTFWNVQIYSKYFSNFFRFAYSHWVCGLHFLLKFFNFCILLISKLWLKNPDTNHSPFYHPILTLTLSKFKKTL